MEKLAISKAIMDKHNNIGRGQISPDVMAMNRQISQPELETFNAPQANYNIPQEFLQESSSVQNTIPTAPAGKDRILNSKLPDEIKKLMIENPIASVNPMSPSNTSVLSDELIEKATKLMGTQSSSPQQVQRPKQTQQVTESTDLKKMMKEVVKEVLMENGLISESSSKANETIMIKVGQHIFEGKISKIKKTK